MVDVRVWFLIPRVYWVLTSKFSNLVRFLLRFVLLAVVASPLQNLTCMYADTHMLCHMGRTQATPAIVVCIQVFS